MLDQMRRAEAEDERAAHDAGREADEIAEAEVAAIGEMCDTLTKAGLIASGFHTHKRQWRRSRYG